MITQQRRRWLQKQAQSCAEESHILARQHAIAGILALLSGLIILYVTIALTVVLKDLLCLLLLGFAIPCIISAYQSFRRVNECRQRWLGKRERFLDRIWEEEG